jgi:cellobiose dehydrogenase (acceptor)
MIDSLLFLAYPDKDVVRTSLRFTSGYSMPGVYSGNATVKQIGSIVNATGFSLTFHCQDCLHWSQSGANGSASTKRGLLDLGYAQSAKELSNPSCSHGLGLVRHDTQGTWTAMLDEHAANGSYDKWRALANNTAPDLCDAT